MRVIFTGSRNWEGMQGERHIHAVLTALENLAGVLGSPLTIVHGDCPTGADAIVDRWARRRDYEPEVFSADWGRNGKAAGPIRNEAMATAGADMCIGFLRGNSPGTSHMLAVARDVAIPTFVIDWDTPPP